MKVTKRPVTVDAHRFDGDAASVQDWLNDLWREYGEPHEGGPDLGKFPMTFHAGECDCPAQDLIDAGVLYLGHHIVIGTLEGPLFVAVGAWIVRGVAGEFYPVRDSIMRETYHLPEGV